MHGRTCTPERCACARIQVTGQSAAVCLVVSEAGRPAPAYEAGLPRAARGSRASAEHSRSTHMDSACKPNACITRAGLRGCISVWCAHSAACVWQQACQGGGLHGKSGELEPATLKVLWVRCACSSHGPHHLQLNGEQHLLPTDGCIPANTRGTARQQQADGTVPCLTMQCLDATPSARQSPVRCQVTLLLSKMSWRAPGVPRHASTNTALVPRQEGSDSGGGARVRGCAAEPHLYVLRQVGLHPQRVAARHAFACRQAPVTQFACQHSNSTPATVPESLVAAVRMSAAPLAHRRAATLRPRTLWGPARRPCRGS